jgi:hypothetical protein
MIGISIQRPAAKTKNVQAIMLAVLPINVPLPNHADVVSRIFRAKERCDHYTVAVENGKVSVNRGEANRIEFGIAFHVYLRLLD